MANKSIYYTAQGQDNYSAAKLGLGSMRGVISMDADDNGGVSVGYDDAFVNETQISACMNPLGYQAAGPRS